MTSAVVLLIASAGSNLWDIFAADPVRVTLFLIMVCVPLLLVIAAYRQFPLHGPYLSGWFVFALLPSLLGALLTLLDLHHFVEAEDLSTPSYVAKRLTGFSQTAVFGFAWSALTIAIYTSFYMLSKRHRAEEHPL